MNSTSGPAEQQPIVFLDIDGVLNSIQFMQKHPKTRTQLDRDAIKLLNQLTEETGCKYVISSTWRLLHALDKLGEVLKEHGFTGEIIGKTPDLRIGKYSDCIQRGNEVLAWIKEHPELTGAAYWDYTKYVIFDDDSDFLLCQRNNFVNTDGYVGLTPKCIFLAKKILGAPSKKSDPPY
jgi:hypothetical protein